MATCFAKVKLFSGLGVISNRVITRVGKFAGYGKNRHNQRRWVNGPFPGAGPFQNPMAAPAIDRLAYDRWQFDRPPMPVDTEYTPDGFQTTGIDYSDDLHVTKAGKTHTHRHQEVPEWVANKPFLKELIVRYMEARAHAGNFVRPPIGHRDRLRAARKRLLARRERLTATLDKLAQEYVRLKKAAPLHAARQRQVAIEIEGLDSQLVHLGREHLLLVGCLHYYYGAGYDSVECARELGLKPPAVRMLIYRANRIAKRMEAEGWRVGRQRNRRLKFDLDKAVKLRRAGLSFAKIGKQLGVTGAGVHATFQAHGLVHKHETGYKALHGGPHNNKFVARPV